MDDRDSELIDLLYGASTGEVPLARPMEMFTRLQEDMGAGVWHVDSITGQNTDVETIVADPAIRIATDTVFAAYSERHADLGNPLIERSADRLYAGEVLSNLDVMPDDEWSEHHYYEEVWKPLGISESMAWMARGKSQRWMVFSTSRNSRQPYQQQHYARSRLFRGHMERALQILEIVREADATQRLFEQAVCAMPCGMLVVDDGRQVLFENPAAEALLRQTPALSTRGNRLRVGSSAAEQARFDSWWRLLLHSSEVPGAIFDDVPMGNVWQLDVTRVSSAGGVVGPGRRWLVGFKQRPSGSYPTVGYLAERFGLSRAEARVCTALCANGDAVSVANALNLSANTVRTHLKSAFRKTGTNNQVALAIELMRGF